MTYLVLAVAIIGVHSADTIYSAWAIGEKGYQEANPLMKWAFDNIDASYMISTPMMVLALAVLRNLHCPAWALAFGLAARILVMIRNVNIVRQYKTRG